MLLSEAELAEMARIGADTGIEVSLFVGPREEWDIGRAAASADGPVFAGRLRGTRQLRYAIDDVLRARRARASAASSSPTPACWSWSPEMQSAGQLPAVHRVEGVGGHSRRPTR